MGEEGKKPEEAKKTEEKKPEEAKKMEEKKPEEAKKTEEVKKEQPKAAEKEEKKADESKDAPPPPAPVPAPPQEIVLRVYMHCEGCARKVRRCLKGFPGVEDVQTDCKTQEVVVKGEKADPLKVLERVQMKSHRQVELLSPIPKPPAPEDAKKPDEKEVANKPDVKKEEPPQVITVVLKVHMHCEACAQEMKKRILRMTGVENVEPDLKSSLVTVKGVFDPPKLVDYVYKRTQKQAVIVKQEPEKKKEEDKGKDEKEVKKSDDDGGGKKGAGAGAVEGEAKEKKDEEAAATAAAAPTEGGEGGGTGGMELKKNDFFFHYPQNYQIYYPPTTHDLYAYQPPPPPPQSNFTYENANGYGPQMFSDENPNACSVM